MKMSDDRAPSVDRSGQLWEVDRPSGGGPPALLYVYGPPTPSVYSISGWQHLCLVATCGGLARDTEWSERYFEGSSCWERDQLMRRLA